MAYCCALDSCLTTACKVTGWMSGAQARARAASSASMVASSIVAAEPRVSQREIPAAGPLSSMFRFPFGLCRVVIFSLDPVAAHGRPAHIPDRQLIGPGVIVVDHTISGQLCERDRAKRMHFVDGFGAVDAVAVAAFAPLVGSAGIAAVQIFRI